MSFKTTWGNLRPVERRLVVGVGVLLFVVANIVWVRPLFGAWGTTQIRLEKARSTLKMFNDEIGGKRKVESSIRDLEKQGGGVAGEDQQNQFQRAVQSQAAQSGVNITGSSRQQTRTNEFFVELLQTFTVQSREEQLVDFLYNLGAGDSMVRVRDISLRPDAAHQQLAGSIKLVASYQKAPRKGRGTTPAATPTTKASPTATTPSKDQKPVPSKK
jgi:type II secretory pathway component PulM